MGEITYTEESLLEEVAKANAFIQNQMLDTPEKVKDAHTRGMFLPMILNATAGALWTLEVLSYHAQGLERPGDQEVP
jgi:uncharacterized protein (DUF2342 family)